MFYAALDVSLRSVAVCIIDDDGKGRLERSVPSDVPGLVRFLNEFGEPIHQVGREAGPLTQHLTYGLREAGFDVVCMEARQVAAALSAMRNKTDKHDAGDIAQILRSGWYSRVHVKSVESHHLRALLTSRNVMKRSCIDLENEIRGLLKMFGVKLPMRLSRAALYAAAKRHAHALDRVVEPEGAGHAADENQGASARHRRRRPKTCCRPAPHVGRRQRVPAQIGGGGMT